MPKGEKRVFRTDNFEYRGNVGYHVRPVIEGEGTNVNYVGLYRDHDAIYFEDSDGDKRTISLPRSIPTRSGPLLDVNFVLQMNDKNFIALASLISSARGTENYHERIEVIERELLEIKELEIRLEQELPGYRGEK